MSMVDDRYRADYSPDSHRSDEDRHDAPAHDATAPDPLTELARLIGQSDPVADARGRRAAARLDGAHDDGDARPAPGWLARPPSAGYDQQGYAEEPDARQAYAYRPAASHEQHYDDRAGYDEAQQQAQGQHYDDGQAHDQYAHEQQAHGTRYADERYADDRHGDERYADDHGADGRYQVAPPAGEYESDEYYDDGHLPPRGDDEGSFVSRRRGGLVTVAAVLGLAVIGTAGAFGYRAYTAPGTGAQAPVIKADPNPVKGPPAATTADTQDKPFQDRAPGTVQTERITPREEAPLQQPIPGPAPWPATPAPRAAVAPPPSPAAVPAPVQATEAKRVRTVTIRPDNNAADTTATAKPAPRAAAKAPAGSPMAIAPAGGDPAATPPVRSAKATEGGHYVVQLSAQKTEGEAKDSYRQLQAKYPGVLGSREANIRRADLDKGVWYRVQLGPFNSMASATELCDSLKASGGQCIVQKN